MKTDEITQTLEKQISKFEQTEAELTDLRAAEPLLRADVETLLHELRDVDPKLLFLGAASAAPDAPTKQKLARLNATKTKLEVLPGCLAKGAERSAKLDQEISTTVEAGVSYIRSAAREQVEKLRARLEPELGGICGGDPGRTKAAIETVLENAEANRWLKELPRAAVSYGDRAGQRGRRFLKILSAFELGSTISAAFK